MAVDIGVRPVCQEFTGRSPPRHRAATAMFARCGLVLMSFMLAPWRVIAAPACVAGPPRPVPELARKAADGAIGTAHPLRLSERGKRADWYLLCQARRDTDGADGCSC
jgi:hypothetical protein